MTNLTSLRIAYAQVKDISVLSGLTKLSALNVSGNQIADITVLANFRDLTYLSLGYNRICDITALSKLTGLKSIWLQRNQISDISPLLWNESISKGVVINLSGNPLSDESVKKHIPALISSCRIVRGCCAVTPPSLNNSSTSPLLHGDGQKKFIFGHFFVHFCLEFC
ncbi:MAG: leucine-rich repeat domain-containing protein [Planctomycetota bacterium]